MTSKKIIDCFIFYNELDLLYYRLSILYPIVDIFVLVESTHTFVGKPKPLFYQDNKERFHAFQNKIIHVVVDDFPYIHPNIDFNQRQQWENEYFQRRSISRGISRLTSLRTDEKSVEERICPFGNSDAPVHRFTEETLNLNNEDLLIISDVDEIPNPVLLPDLKGYMNNHEYKDIFMFNMTFYYYNLYTRIISESWYHAKILTYQKYRDYGGDCENIRRIQCSYIERGGWHLSYFGDPKFIQNKIKMFSHQEYAGDEYTDLEKIEQHMKLSNDLFNRNNVQFMRVSLALNDDLPYQYEMYLKSFY